MKGRGVVIATMFMLFSMIQFLLNFAGAMGVVIQNQFGVSNALAQLGPAALFLAFLFMGIPGGIVLKRRGYRFTAMLATGFAFAAMGVQLASGFAASFAVYVVGTFLSGFAACLLNIVVNPMLNSLGGGGNKGNQLVLIGCSLNLVCGMLAPLVTGLLVGGEVESAKVLDVAPVLAVGMLLFAAAFVVVFLAKMPEPRLEDAPVRLEAIKDVFKFRHFAFGVLAIFLYEVIESGIPNMANLYMSNMKEVGPAVSGSVISTYWLTMTIGCAIGGILGSRVSARMMMATCSFAGMALLAAVIFMPPEMTTIFGKTIPKSMVLMALCGFCTSIMWSSIFNLAVEGLGNRLELASGIFMTMVCGGMLLPLQGLLADKIGILNSYTLTILLFAYLFVYAVVLSRPKARTRTVSARPMLVVLAFATAFAACAASGEASTDEKWPFIVIRHTNAINSSPETFKRLIDCHRRHPGACDEFWFSAGGRSEPKTVAEKCAAFARFRPLCDEVGIALSYQQGLTLGHGEAHDGKPKPDEQPLPEDAWQVDPSGKRIHILCPRSPAVIAYERAFAKAVISTANPASYWLDDDLRLGVCKPNGCFCDRCIAAFNAKTGGNWTRETLTSKLFSKTVREPVRAAWLDFNAESLAVYAAAVRQAADELKSPCRLAYQSVWADMTYTASSYRPLLEALAGKERKSVGIRPGAGFYTEAEPRGMVKKCLSVAREAERCRTYGDLVASICYEQETYPRHVLHKSPGAIMTESALALASGCDSLSLYWYSHSAPEPVEEYDRFVRTLAKARPYFKRLAESTRRTRLGGVARFLGSAALELGKFDLRDAADFNLACAGIPVTVAEARPNAWYLTAESKAALTESDEKLLASSAVVKVEDIEKYPLASRRAKLLDDLDAATGGAFPVRIDTCRPLRILPRVREDGSLDSVTILNLSIGDTDELKVRVRKPASANASWQDAQHAPSQLNIERGARTNEQVVTIPNMTAWQIGTIFFD